MVEFSEIEQLHFKIMQLRDVHNFVAKNESVSVFHDKERKEQFTSFERFQAYNANATSPTVSVVLKYNFAIIPAGLKKPQEYVLTIRLSNRVALAKALEDEAPAFIRGRLFGYIGEPALEVTIEYADYIVARGFLEALEEWVAGCAKTPRSLSLDFFQRWSHLIPHLFKILMPSLIIFYALREVPAFFSVEPNMVLWTRFYIVYGGALYVLSHMALLCGALIERYVDGFTRLSYIKLNKGDKIIIDEFCEKRKFVTLRFIGSCVFAIILGVISSKLSTLV